MARRTLEASPRPCFNAGDGKVVAIGNPNRKGDIGQDERTIKDSTGKAFGLEYYNAARTHLGIAKDAPDHRPIERCGAIISVPALGGLHHRYARI